MHALSVQSAAWNWRVVRRWSVWSMAGSLERGGEPPAVAFGVDGAVLALAVGHVFGLALDGCAAGSGAGAVGVDVVDVDDDARAGGGQGTRGGEVVLRGHAVEPDGLIAGADFGVDGLAFGRAVHAARCEAECLDEEVVGGGDVLVDERGDESLDLWHGRPFYWRGGGCWRKCHGGDRSKRGRRPVLAFTSPPVQPDALAVQVVLR